MEFAQQYKVTDEATIAALLEKLNLHLAMRSFVVGHHISLADIAVWALLSRKFEKVSLSVSHILWRMEILLSFSLKFI
jgi:glutathione S-transferase